MAAAVLSPATHHNKLGTILEPATSVNVSAVSSLPSFEQSVPQGLGTVRTAASAAGDSHDRSASSEADRLLMDAVATPVGMTPALDRLHRKL